MREWILAARLKTLLVSMASVIMAVALSSKYVEIQWLPAAICLVFAVMAQIVSNFVNDYCDGVRGSDSERLGPERMVASGKITPKKMLRGTLVMVALSFALGCTLLYWGGLILLPFGIVILLCAVGYSMGPFPFSRHALGDVAVILFYGIVPVALTFYIQTKMMNFQVVASGLAMGIVTDNLLIVNNYRDADQDAENGKLTTVVLFGKKIMKLMFYSNPLIGVGLGFYFMKDIANPIIWFLASIPFLVYFTMVSVKFTKAEGRGFNKLIGMSSMGAVLFAITVAVVTQL